MLAAVVRSGVVEAVHEGAVAIVDTSGRLLASSGEIDRPFLGRSSFKPFQAQAGLEAGSGLTGAHLAITCASHPAYPAHVAMVGDVLTQAGLTEGALQTPASYPFEPGAAKYLDPGDPPRPIWHNCSGKHAGMLAACRGGDLDTTTYLDPQHPLQRSIESLIEDVTGESHGPPAVDGCGAPAFLTTVLGMARAFAELATNDRFERVRTAMRRHPRLVGDASWIDVTSMVLVNGVAKGGAEAVIGVGLPAGFGVAVKVWDGALRGLHPAVLEVLHQLGLLDRRAVQQAALPVYGGVGQVGEVESRLQLEWAP